MFNADLHVTRTGIDPPNGGFGVLAALMCIAIVAITVGKGMRPDLFDRWTVSTEDAVATLSLLVISIIALKVALDLEGVRWGAFLALGAAVALSTGALEARRPATNDPPDPGRRTRQAKRDDR